MKYLSGKVSKKGIVVIPVEVRRKLNIEEGDKLEFLINEEQSGASMYTVKKKSVLDVFGVVETDKGIPSTDQIRKEIKKGIAKTIADEGANHE